MAHENFHEDKFLENRNYLHSLIFNIYETVNFETVRLELCPKEMARYKSNDSGEL